MRATPKCIGSFGAVIAAVRVGNRSRLPDTHTMLKWVRSEPKPERHLSKSADQMKIGSARAAKPERLVFHKDE